MYVCVYTYIYIYYSCFLLFLVFCSKDIVFINTIIIIITTEQADGEARKREAAPGWDSRPCSLESSTRAKQMETQRDSIV